MPELCLKVVTEPPIALNTLRPDVPVGIGAVIERCLEKDLKKRFANAAELASALEPFVHPGSRVLADRARLAMGSGSGARSAAPFAASAPSSPAMQGSSGSTPGTSAPWGTDRVVTPGWRRRLLRICAGHVEGALGATPRSRRGRDRSGGPRFGSRDVCVGSAGRPSRRRARAERSSCLASERRDGGPPADGLGFCRGARLPGAFGRRRRSSPEQRRRPAASPRRQSDFDGRRHPDHPLTTSARIRPSAVTGRHGGVAQ